MAPTLSYRAAIFALHVQTEALVGTHIILLAAMHGPSIKRSTHEISTTARGQCLPASLRVLAIREQARTDGASRALG